MERLACPVAHRAPGAFDHRDQRGEIVQLEARFADHVEVPARQHGIVVAVAAHDHPLVVGRLGERHEHVAFLVAEVVRAGGGERGVRQIGARPSQGRLAVHHGRLPGHAEPALAEHRLVDHSKHREALDHERDQRAEGRPPGEERGGAVDRVEHPLPSRAARDRAEFFAEHRIVRHLGGEQGAHRLLRLAVGQCDGRRVGLALVVHPGAEMRQHRRARAISAARFMRSRR